MQRPWRLAASGLVPPSHTFSTHPFPRTRCLLRASSHHSIPRLQQGGGLEPLPLSTALSFPPPQLLSLSTNLPGVAQFGQAICSRRLYCRKLPGDWAPVAVGSGVRGRKPPTPFYTFYLALYSIRVTRLYQPSWPGFAPASTCGAPLVPDCVE